MSDQAAGDQDQNKISQGTGVGNTAAPLPPTATDSDAGGGAPKLLTLDAPADAEGGAPPAPPVPPAEEEKEPEALEGGAVTAQNLTSTTGQVEEEGTVSRGPVTDVAE